MNKLLTLKVIQNNKEKVGKQISNGKIFFFTNLYDFPQLEEGHNVIMRETGLLEGEIVKIK